MSKSGNNLHVGYGKKRKLILLQIYHQMTLSSEVDTNSNKNWNAKIDHFHFYVNHTTRGNIRTINQLWYHPSSSSFLFIHIIVGRRQLRVFFQSKKRKCDFTLTLLKSRSSTDSLHIWKTKTIIKFPKEQKAKKRDDLHE